MSQALDLLNSLTDEEIAAYSAGNGENEPHVIIGDDRYIKVPESLKRVAVQYDHDVETVIFDCPRYWDGLDMSEMAIYINYIRSDKYGDSYPAKNVTVEDDIMHFEWTISRNVTAVKGQLAFLVCIKKSDDEGNEVNHWNSEICTDMYISEGMETEEQIEDLSSDLVTQLLLRMDSVEQINVDSETMTQLLADTTEEANRAEDARDEADAILAEVAAKDDYIKDMYANAVKGNVSGEIVRVDDVSPIEHNVKCSVHGKNLFDSSDNSTEKDYSTGEQVYSFSTKHLVIGREYTVFSEVPMRWFKISNSITGYSCAGLSNFVSGFTSYTFTHNRNVNIPDTEELRIYVGNLDKTADTDLSVLESMKICIVEGPVATTYEPYIDPSTTTVITCGKNLAPENNFSITGTTMAYGSIGDFTGSVLVRNIPIKPGVTYTISAIKPAEVTGMTAFLYNGLLSDNVVKHNGCYTAVYVTGIGTQIQIPSDGIITNTDGYEYMAITTGNVSGYTEGSSVTINIKKLQIEIGDTATVFEAYKGSENAGGLDVTVSSILPIMTIFTDTPGTIVEAEYNRDTTKMFESYVLTDKAKSEIVDEIEYDLDKQYGNIETALDEIIEIQEDLIVPNGDEVSY